MTDKGNAMRLLMCAMFALLLVGAAPARPSEPPVVRVRLDTTAGAITLAIDVRHAPKTAANFLAYVDDERLDGTRFYRAARTRQAGVGFIQGGIDTDARRRLEPVELEPTSRTGLRHIVGAISMARYGSPNSGTGNFSLLTGPRPDMDARPGYQGYAWYRRPVTVPAGNRAWDILGPPAVDDGYELYWNGARLGGLGRLGESPKVVGRRPMIFALPADAAGKQGVLAIRVFMQPGIHTSTDSGGIRVAPSLAPQPEGRALYRAQWWRTIAGYIVELVEPLAMFAAVGLALAIRRRSSHPAFIVFICIALALSGVKRLDNAIVSWTDLLSLPTYSWLTRVLWTPLSLAAWALAWNRWCLRSRIIDGVALVLGVLGVAGGAMRVMALTQISRLGLLALLVLIAVGMIRGGPLRFMAAATMILIVISQFTGELRSIGVPDIWFPFGIGVTLVQYIYAIAIPLLALLIVRTLDSESARS